MPLSRHTARALRRLKVQPSRISNIIEQAAVFHYLSPLYKVIFIKRIKGICFSLDFDMTSDFSFCCIFKVEGRQVAILVFSHTVELPVIAPIARIVFVYNPSFAFARMSFKTPPF